jgi:hypothetical protein
MAVARKVQYTSDKLALEVDVQVIPLALTPEQIRHYNLPRRPINDSKRKEKFEAIHGGGGATELDALEALHPGELAKLLNAELDNWLDRSLGTRTGNFHSDLRLRLRKIDDRVYKKHAGKIDDLKLSFGHVTHRLREVATEFDDWEEEAAEVYQAIAADLEKLLPDLSDEEIPQSEARGKTDRFILFDSKRGEIAQIEAYSAWRNGEE